MITPLKIGTKVFSNNLIQGPLAGVSCSPFRALAWRYSQPAFSCTEMISVKTLIHKPIHIQKRYITKDPKEGPVCFQLAGNNPHEIAEAVKIVTDSGADLIDLNCGCPVKKIRRKGLGSSLLNSSKNLFSLITAMKNNTHLPISIKIRVDGSSSDRFNQEIANIVQEAGADFLIVHGRHWTENYKTQCRYDDIQFFVKALKIPVIGNGDIHCLTTLNKMFATGCAGVMISRAGMGQPWLIRQLISEAHNLPFSKPSSIEIGSLYIEHIHKLITLLDNEKFALFQARKFAKYYARSLSSKIDFCNAINACSTFKELKIITQHYFNE